MAAAFHITSLLWLASALARPFLCSSRHMLALLSTGLLFSSLLAFGNKWIYVSTHRHATGLSILALVSTFMIMFLPLEISECQTAPIAHPEMVTMLLITAEFVRVVFETESDLFLVGLVHAHIISRYATHADSDPCTSGIFSASIFILFLCVCVHLNRHMWHLSGPFSTQCAAADLSTLPAEKDCIKF